MYKYGISYYKMEEGERVPLSGVDVRLLSKGSSWSEGIQLLEKETSGYYECFLIEDDCGYYEVWDNRGDPGGTFTGKTCTIGKLNASGLQNDCIYSVHINDGAVNGDKIANGVIKSNHLGDDLFALSKIVHEYQDERDGVGNVSQDKPASLDVDQEITHTLNREYRSVPYVILTPQCNTFLYVTDIILVKTQVSVFLRIGYNYDAHDIKYMLLAIPFD